MVLPFMPSRIIKSLNNIITEFIWNKKKPKIALNILQNKKKEGGLNLVNLQKKDIYITKGNMAYHPSTGKGLCTCCI